jgi:glycosyltransferase involved in cell wall biosynthesis
MDLNAPGRGPLAGSRVAILNGNHLCHNPRVVKEADCLARAGCEVEVLGAALDPRLAERDRALAATQRFGYRTVFSMVPASRWPAIALRARRRAAFEAKRVLGLELPGALGYGVDAMRRAALSTPADLYIAHSESMLWVARELRARGRRTGVDMEDWFSEDLLAEAQAVRPQRLLRDLESEALRHGAHRTCTSNAMADALASAYGCAPPLAVYNAFPWADRVAIDGRTVDRSSGDVSIHWFSQSVGPGRGLEDLFAALPLLGTKFQLHVRGAIAPAYREWLDRQVPAGCPVHFHDLVANDSLLSRIAEHDIGVSLDPVRPTSRNVTITNKILQYLQAGLAVVASATAGNREVAALAPGAVRLCAPGDPRELADALRALIDSPANLHAAKAASLSAAERTFSWERVAPRVVASVERALGRAP